jgi:hypothetical protein
MDGQTKYDARNAMRRFFVDFSGGYIDPRVISPFRLTSDSISRLLMLYFLENLFLEKLI